MSYKLIKVGRGADNDIVLNHDEISTHHVEFFMDESGLVFITDMNSNNGSYVNNIRMTSSAQLQPNDKVRLGTIEIDWMDYFRIKPQSFSTKPNRVSSKKSESSGVPLYAYIIIAVVFLCGGIYALNEFVLTDQNTNESSSNSSSQSSSGGSSGTTSEDSELTIPKDIEYNYDCLGTDLLNEASALESDLINMTGIEVTVEEEEEVGKEVYDQMKEEYDFTNGVYLNRCQTIMDRLVPHIKDAKGFNYKIYVMETEMINAFTVGGYIFVTTGIIDFSKNDSELACIIGHEIAHNERGHIEKQVKKNKFNQGLFGDVFGEVATGLGNMFTAPFNQKNETESDFYGIGYAYAAGYDPCVSIELWKRMSEDESEFNHLENMMRTHPFSIKRSECCRNHIESNYNKTCP